MNFKLLFRNIFSSFGRKKKTLQSMSVKALNNPHLFLDNQLQPPISPLLFPSHFHRFKYTASIF